jgi:hypothetical protein
LFFNVRVHQLAVHESCREDRRLIVCCVPRKCDSRADHGRHKTDRLRSLLTGETLEFQYRTHVVMDSRGIQLHAFVARTFETGVSRKGQVAALFADKSRVQMRHHGPELNAENAVGTTDDSKGHKSSWCRDSASNQTNVQPTTLSPPVGNQFISD